MLEQNLIARLGQDHLHRTIFIGVGTDARQFTQATRGDDHGQFLFGEPGVEVVQLLAALGEFLAAFPQGFLERGPGLVAFDHGILALPQGESVGFEAFAQVEHLVRLRLQRLGRKNRPFYRLSAIDGRTRRDGRVIETLGWYDPLAAADKQLQLNDERTKHWLAMGAQPSDTVRNILAKRNLIDVKAWETDRGHERRKLDARVVAAAAAGDAKDEKKA